MNKLLKPLEDPFTAAELTDMISKINTVITAALGLLTAGVVILAVFIAFKFFTADDEGKRKNAKNQLIYCIIGIVVLVALLILAPNIVTMIKDTIK